MMKRVLMMATVASCGALFVLLFTTNPGSVSPAGMLGVFILGYVSLLGVVTFLLYYGSRGLRSIAHILMNRRVRSGISLRRSYLFGSVLAALPMILISLRSAGGLMWYEPILVIIFGGIGLVYVAKRTR